MSLSPSSKDRLLLWTLRGCGAVSGVIVLLISIFLIAKSLPALQHIGPRLFTDASWHPSEDRYNLSPLIAGTLAASAGAVALALPLGILSALFCTYYAPRPLALIFERLLEVLAGIPSVIYGFWGLMVLVPMLRQIKPPGSSLLAGILILTMMILPTIALMARAALARVPESDLHGAAALGLSRWAIIRNVALPHAQAGIFTGVLLAAGRALGETMAVLMVCGKVVQTPTSLFQPIRTLTANIALEMGPAVGDHRSALFVSGLLLLGMVMALVAAAEWISKGRVYHSA